jgi:hypothetical protein
MLNPNISGEMGKLLIRDQSNYIPTLDTVDGEKVILEKIFMDGDQLTEERGRNVQWVFKDCDNSYDRLEGIDLTHADWHAKVNLYTVSTLVYDYLPIEYLYANCLQYWSTVSE